MRHLSHRLRCQPAFSHRVYGHIIFKVCLAASGYCSVVCLKYAHISSRCFCSAISVATEAVRERSLNEILHFSVIIKNARRHTFNSSVQYALDCSWVGLRVDACLLSQVHRMPCDRQISYRLSRVVSDKTFTFIATSQICYAVEVYDLYDVVPS